MEEIHRQTCQSCGSIDLRNILVREPDLPTTIYVRCAKCGELVARYKLSDYYHHGKGIESFLRSHRFLSQESGRSVLEEFKKTQMDSEKGYERVLKYLREHGKEV